MNHIVNSIMENFPNVEGCFLIKINGTEELQIDELSRNPLINPWMDWIISNSNSFEEGRIHLTDASQLIIKNFGESALIIHNKEENATLITSFINTLSVDELKVTGSTIKPPEVLETDFQMLDAVRIQKMIIPRKEEVRKSFKEFFVVHQQQDIVGGDFYWYKKTDEVVLLALVDCTGHGIEGAMTSMVCNSLLNQVSSLYSIDQPEKMIVEFFRLLNEYNSSTQDILNYGLGAEIGLLAFDYSRNNIQFVSSGIDVIVKRQNSMDLIKGKKLMTYENIEKSLTISQIDMLGVIGIYTFTDGLSDQFDSNDKKKLGRKGIQRMIEQEKGFGENYYQNEIEKWKGNNMQYDDITLLGIAI